MLSGRHLIQPDDLTVSEIEEICSLAEQIIVDPKSFSRCVSRENSCDTFF